MRDVLASLRAELATAQGMIRELTEALAIARQDDECRHLEAKLQTANARNAELVQVLDQQFGHPCEQIRHAQEIEELRASLATAQAEIADKDRHFNEMARNKSNASFERDRLCPPLPENDDVT